MTTLHSADANKMSLLPLDASAGTDHSVDIPTSFLEDVNKAAKALERALSQGRSSTDPASYQTLVQKSAQSTIHSAKGKDLELSAESRYDFDRLQEFTRTITARFQQIKQETPTLLDSNTAANIQEAIDFLKKLERSFIRLLRLDPKAYNPSTTYMNRILQTGICYGHAMAIIDEDPLDLSMQDVNKRALKRERKARFYQAVGKTNEYFFFGNSPEEIGNIVLRNALSYADIIKKTAQILGYTGREDQFLIDLQHDIAPFSLEAIEGLIGKFVLRKIYQAEKELQAKKCVIDEVRLKKRSLAKKIEQNKQRLVSLEKREASYQASTQALLEETSCLANAMKQSETTLQIGLFVLANAQQYPSILKLVREQYGLTTGQECTFVQALEVQDTQKYQEIVEFTGNTALQIFFELSAKHKKEMDDLILLTKERLELAQSLKELKLKLSSLGKEELELVLPYAILQNEQLAFLRLAELAKSNPTFSGFLPPSIKTQRGITEERAPIEDAPVSQLESRLMPFDGKKGEYLITFQRPWGDFAHSLYIDFQTRRFCDVMDSRFKTFFAKERFFGTHEEMLSELTSYTSSTYQGKYPLFSLWHYEKTP